MVPKLRGQHESVVHAEAREHEVEAVVELGVGHAEVSMRPMALSMVKPTITPAATASVLTEWQETARGFSARRQQRRKLIIAGESLKKRALANPPDNYL